MKKNETNCWANRKMKNHKKEKNMKTTDSIIKQILDSSGTWKDHLGIHRAGLHPPWARLLCLPAFFSWRCSRHNTFCAMKPPTSNSSWSLLHSFFVTLFFALQFSIFHHSWQRPSPLQELKFVVASFHVLSYPSSPACIDSSMLVPFFAANNQNTFYTVLMLLYYGPLFLPCMSRPPKRVWPHLPSLCLEFSLHLSLYLHVTAASSASHTPILACCRTPLRPMLLCLGPLLFGVGSSCSQSFHSQASAKKKRWLRGICTLEGPNLLTITHFGVGVRKRGGSRNLHVMCP